MINPGGIPLIVADLDAVAGHGATLRATGREFATTGADVHAGWQGLSAVYRAPEAEQLFAATGPVRTTSADVGADITAVGDALVGYADEVRPIQAQLARLRAEAGAFVSSVAGEEDWRADSGKVDTHNALLSGVSTAVAAWMDAQRRCANAINTRVGGTQYAADNGDGRVEAHEYGYTTAQLDAAAKTKEGGLWGRAEERDKPWWQDALSGYGSFLKGVWVDGAGGAVKGLWGFLNVTDGETFRQSWTALGKLSLAVNPLYLALNQLTALPGLDKGELLSTLRDTGKGIVAWDTWDDDPARAAGAAGFNIITAVVGTKGAGAGARGAGAAARAGSITVREVAAGVRAALGQAPRSAGAWGRALPQRFAPGQLAVPGVGALPSGGVGGPTLGAAMAETRGAYAAGAARGRGPGGHGRSGSGRDTPTRGPHPTQAPRSSREALPDWLRRVAQGREWHRAEQARLGRDSRGVAELYLEGTRGRRYRVDFYDPARREIVSMKHSQLAEIQPRSARAYLEELAKKYPRNARIADVPSTPPALRGRYLVGGPVLHVPVQRAPIPQHILDYARQLGIIIRDSNGKVYR